MKLKKIGQPVGGCYVGHGGEKESLTLCWKTRSRSRMDCRLVTNVDDYRNEDACACQ